jgi:hypothetical protein
MHMPTRKAGEPTQYYTGIAPDHTEDMDHIFTGRSCLEGETFLYNIRLDNPLDNQFINRLYIVEDVKALMQTPEWRELDEDN